MWHDVRNGASMNRKNNPLPRLHGGNHLRGVISEFSDSNFHVLHSSTWTVGSAYSAVAVIGTRVVTTTSSNSVGPSVTLVA